MSDTGKKTLKLKSASKKAEDVAAMDSTVDTTVAGGTVPVMGAMGGGSVSDGPSYTVPAVVAIIAAMVFAAIVVVQLMELQAYSIPTLQ